MAWETVIGLEVHIQLATRSKIFSTAPTAYGDAISGASAETRLGSSASVLRSGNARCGYAGAVRASGRAPRVRTVHAEAGARSLYVPLLRSPRGARVSSARPPQSARVVDKHIDPAELRAGQCTVQQIPDDTKSIWLYYRGAPKDIRARSVLFSGVATRDANVGLIVRDLTATHFLNDGFNIHGKARRCRFERVRGVDNRDEGLSLHNQSEAVIVDSIFTGNDNGVADINESESRYEACVFSDNRSNAIVFSGGTHTLVGGEVRSSNVPGVTVRIHEGKRARTKEVIPVACVFERVTFRDPQNGGKLFIGAGAVVDLTDIQLDGVQLVSDPTAVVRQSTTTN